jgi:hypothetical protein
MTGLTNYSAFATLFWLTGQEPFPTLPAVFCGLFVAPVGTDAGTGFTEVSGGSYARVQVAGQLAAGASFTTSSTTITLGSTAPAWLLALGTNGSGVQIFDITASAFIGTVSSITGTTVTLTSTAAHASSGAADSLAFSAFGTPTGTAPSTITNTAVINFVQATASWGTVIAFGLFDASTSGNLTTWDFIGGFNWLPFEVPTGSNPTFTAKANGFALNDPIVFTAEYGGTLPTASTGTFTGYNILFVANPLTDTFQVDTTSGPTTPVVLTSSGSGQVRKITQQSIPANVAANFPASSFTMTGA